MATRFNLLELVAIGWIRWEEIQRVTFRFCWVTSIQHNIYIYIHNNKWHVAYSIMHIYIYMDYVLLEFACALRVLLTALNLFPETNKCMPCNDIYLVWLSVWMFSGLLELHTYYIRWVIIWPGDQMKYSTHTYSNCYAQNRKLKRWSFWFLK